MHTVTGILCSTTTLMETASKRICRLCRDIVSGHRAVGIFFAQLVSSNSGHPELTLLSVPVNKSDGPPNYICQKCKLRVVSLERLLQICENSNNLLFVSDLH